MEKNPDPVWYRTHVTMAMCRRAEGLNRKAIRWTPVDYI